MEAYAKETGKALQLNKWYDCTEEEYAAFASGNNSSADEVEEEQEVYAEVLFSEAETKQALYTCSEEEYIALTSGKAKVKIVPQESIKVLDAELVDAEAEESRLAAQAEALERAKEDTKAAAAKFQMETQERDRILADKEAKAKADE